MLELSKAVQRLIDVERKANDELQEELAATKAALAAKEEALSPEKVKALIVGVAWEHQSCCQMVFVPSSRQLLLPRRRPCQLET